MRQIIATIVLAASMIAVSTNARAGSHLTRLIVEGLDCPVCGYALEAPLMKLAGVIRVEADYREGAVTITMPDGPSRLTSPLI